MAVLLVPVHADPSALETTQLILTNQHVTYTVAQVDAIRRSLMTTPPLLAILQSGAQQRDTLDVLRGLTSYKIPTLVLVEQLSDAHEAALLNNGALDVVGLPTSIARLTARVMAMQRYTESTGRRLDSPLAEHYSVGDLTIDVGRREVCVSGQPVSVTKTEFDLLVALVRHPRTVLTREELSQQALSGRTVGSHALESHISRLRSKILSAQGPRLIEPIRGVGYRLGA